MAAAASARADREQNFLPERIFELLELQRCFTLVAQHFEHGRAIFFRHLDATIFQMHYVHLQRLDLKVPVVAAARTSQCHRWDLPKHRSYGMVRGGRNENRART